MWRRVTFGLIVALALAVIGAVISGEVSVTLKLPQAVGQPPEPATTLHPAVWASLLFVAGAVVILCGVALVRLAYRLVTRSGRTPN